MYTRHEYKRYPVTLTYTCTKNYRKRMEYIGVCACAESRTRIDKYVREHTSIDTERPKGKQANTRTYVNTHRRGSKQSAIMKSIEHNIGKLWVSIYSGANRSNWTNRRKGLCHCCSKESIRRRDVTTRVKQSSSNGGKSWKFVRRCRATSSQTNPHSPYNWTNKTKFLWNYTNVLRLKWLFVLSLVSRWVSRQISCRIFLC